MQNQQPIGMLQQLQNAVSGSDRNASDRLAIALMSLSGASPSLQPMIAMANQGMQKRQTLEREQEATNKSLEYLQKAAQTDPLAAQFLQAAGSIGAGQAATQYLNVKMQDRNRKLSARPAAPSAIQQKAAMAVKAGFPEGSPQYNEIVFGLRAPEKSKRDSKEDVNGRLRYMDTGELVFPDATPNTPVPNTATDVNGVLRYLDGPNAGQEVFDVEKVVEPPSPVSAIGKINEDFNNGLMDEETRSNAIKKATTLKPSEAFTVTMADGSTVSYGAGGGKPITESESKKMAFAKRLPPELLDRLDEVDSALANYPDSILENDPTGYARGTLQNPKYQIAKQLAGEFVTPLIRQDTGAAIQAWETQLYNKMYFPAPGDTEETILRKRRARRIAREGLMVGISPLKRIKVDPEFKEQFLATIPEGDPLRAKVGATEKVLKAAPTQSQQGSQPSRFDSMTDQQLDEALLNAPVGSQDEAIIVDLMEKRGLLN